VRYLFVVSRAQPWLYRHLVERFEDDRNVDIILDRRIGERRRDPTRSPDAPDRRRGEHRRPVGPDQDLQIHSHYIVEL
jgi:hypothetical protein